MAAGVSLGFGSRSAEPNCDIDLRPAGPHFGAAAQAPPLKVPSTIAGDRLIHDAVHEFKTPLTVIREFASILEDGLCSPGVVTEKDCVRAIRGASGELLDMLESFRAVAAARFEAARTVRGPVSLAAIWDEIRPALASRAAERNVGLDAAIDPGASPLEVDGPQVARALRAVVRSAIRSTPAGGRVVCWARQRSRARLAFGCLDGGPALSPEDARLFEQGESGAGLERRSRICTFGLDLEFARVVAEQNGGKVRLRPAPGGGRACLVLLPVITAADVDASHESRRQVQSLGSPR